MSEDRQEWFAAYVGALAEVIGLADRAAALRDYCPGLLLGIMMSIRRLRV